MRILLLALALVVSGCGDSLTAPTKPPYVSLYNPQPTPAPLNECRLIRGVLLCPR